jgi:adenylate cyclase
MVIVLPLASIAYYTFNVNREFALSTIEREFELGLNDAVNSIRLPLENSQGLMRVVAETAASNQKLVKLEEFNLILKSALESSKVLDAIYVSLEDGYHRTVTRVDPQRRKVDSQMPAKTEWTSSVIEPFANTNSYRKRKIKYYGQWPLLISRGEQGANKLDIRTLNHYVRTKEESKLYVGPIVTNPHTGSPVISIGMPIMVKGNFVGIIGANARLDYIKNILYESKITANGTSSIVDSRGDVILHGPLQKKKYSKVYSKLDGDKEAEPSMSRIHDDQFAIQKAYLSDLVKEASRGDNRLIQFNSEYQGVGYLQRMVLPSSVGAGLELILAAPYQDFVGKVVQTSKAIGWFTLIICVVSIVLFYCYGSWLSVKIKKATIALNDVHIRSTNLEHSKFPSFTEIADFQLAVSDLNQKLMDLHHLNDHSTQNKCIVCGAPRFDGNENYDQSR